MEERHGAPDLYEFLVEAELQQYYSSLKNELKIAAIHQLKYATENDFKSIGFSRPEIRRLNKFYDKYYSQGYLSKIKRLLQAPKRDECTTQGPIVEVLSKPPTSPGGKVPNNKHIIPLDSISVNKQLGVGEFGIVQQGVWTNGNERIQVAIKCLCRERMQSNPMEFLKEAAIMHSIDHENIVRLYGVVLSTDSLMLVTELAHLRSLLECLKDSDLRVKFLTVPVLCDFAQQICNGMMYLESNRLIHRDLAARNILVFSKNKVKISDFGLSRALGVGKDYYKTNFNVNLKLPIAWCAPECVNYLKFTSASDVWAYAVCLWEMFSYGFQPWPAFTGHQILEAIDKPNFQRLEQPECCPKEYYTLMLKCWSHDPLKRPKFSDISELLPDMKPEQLKTVTQFAEPKKDHLAYRQGEIITVLDKSTNSPYWNGVLNSGKTGHFNPANTVAHLESLPSSSSNHHTQPGGFIRNTLERNSKRKLNTDMISGPQNDLKHTGHVGIDGAYFGNVAFLSNPQTYTKLPRQVVTPYKPSEDLEQTPLLLPPTPTSPDSMQMGSAYFSESSNLIANAQLDRSHNNESLSSDFQRLSSTPAGNRNSIHNPMSNGSFNDSNPFAQEVWNSEIAKSFVTLSSDKKLWDNQESHDYHEISDDEMLPNDKVFDFGPSLLDEMDFMFRSMTTSGDSSSLNPPLTPNFDNVNKRNEMTEINSKLNRKGSGTNGNGLASGMSAVATYKSKKKPTTVKPISVKDEKILNQAIEIANEMSARSMTDLDQNSSTHSPRRKFSFRFPNLSHSTSHDKDGSSLTSGGGHNTLNHHQTGHYLSKERRNFSQEAKNVPDLQRFRSLTEIENFRDGPRDLKIPIFDKKSSDFCFEKSREILSKPFSIDLNPTTLDRRSFDKKTRDLIGENLLDIEKTLNALNLDFLQAFNELEKTDSAETLFGENFLLENNLKAQGSMKTMSNFKKFTNDLDNKAKKSATRDYYSPLEKRSTVSDKSYSPKDSQKTTPNSYSPQESTATSRGFFFNYNPINNRSMFLSPTKRMFANQQFLNQARKYDESIQGPRQRGRSMSFTENLEIKSPISFVGLAKTQLNQKPAEVKKTGSLDEEKAERSYILPTQSELNAIKPRNIITYKPKSVRARTLRRLSYNPLNIVDSSSSSSESEMDRSIAHSECDIRSKIYSSRFQKRRQQYLGNHRKLNNSNSSSYYQRNGSQYSNNSSNSNVNGRDKLYGSNASIKSAPHYNYMSDRKKFPNEDHVMGGEEKTTLSSSDLDSDDDFNNSVSDQRKKNLFTKTRTLTPTPQTQQPPQPTPPQPPITSNFNNIYEFVGKCFNRSYNTTTPTDKPSVKQATSFMKNSYGNVKGGKMSSSNLDLLYSDFDVTKLTGKSPTTQSYFDIMDYSNMNKKQSIKQSDNKTLTTPRSGTFHWPEKIHGATVKQNDLIWQLQQQHEQDMQEKEERRQQQKRQLIENLKMKKKSAYSSDSTSTENDSLNFYKDFMPPSPAP